MVNRRSFLLKEAPSAALGMAWTLGLPTRTLLAQDASSPPSYFELVTFRLHSGDQTPRLLGWLERHALPLLQKYRLGPVGVFTVEVGPHIPVVVALLTAPSLTELEARWRKIETDATWVAALEEVEKEGPAFFREDTSLLKATPFSPPLAEATPGASARKIFELRIYESPTLRQLGYLHERFAGGEIELFHKSGIHPILYADTVIGPNKPNMVYLTPFENHAHREKAWAAFRDNPDWHELRDDSIRRGGEIVQNLSSVILVPTSFSMIR